MKRWYANDFTLAELKTLDAGSWFDARFAGARIPTFEEAIALVKGRAGIFPELKSPARLNARGADVEQAVADVLREARPDRRAGEGPARGLPAVVRGEERAPAGDAAAGGAADAAGRGGRTRRAG